MSHGHVVPRADGVKARCGGPAICSDCAKEQAEFLCRPNWMAGPTEQNASSPEKEGVAEEKPGFVLRVLRRLDEAELILRLVSSHFTNEAAGFGGGKEAIKGALGEYFEGSAGLSDEHLFKAIVAAAESLKYSKELGPLRRGLIMYITGFAEAAEREKYELKAD